MNKLSTSILILFIFIGSNVFGQVFEHPEIIKKKKKRALYASKKINYPDSTATIENYSYWEFDEDGHEILEIDYEKNGNIHLKINNRYEDGKLVETIEDKKFLTEIEKVVYEYNDKGLLTKKTDFRNDEKIISYEYFYGDGEELDSTIWYDKDGKPQLYEYFTYEKGRLVEINEKTGYGRIDGRTEITYHSDGTLKEEKLYDGFGELFELLTYNELGWMIQREVYYDEKKITYNYYYKMNGLMKSSTKSTSGSSITEEINYKWSKHPKE